MRVAQAFFEMLSLHTAGAREIELTNQDSVGGKNSSVLTSSLNQATFVTGDGTKRDLQFQKPN